MNTSEAIKRIAGRMQKSLKETKVLYTHCIGVMNDHLVERNHFNIPRLGTFGSVERKERQAYNPHFKKKMLIPRKVSVFFKPSRALKEEIK